VAPLREVRGPGVPHGRKLTQPGRRSIPGMHAAARALYPWILFAHSWMRWLVLLVLAAALARAIIGWRARRPFAARDEAVAGMLVGTVDLQVLLGLVLYVFLSPFSSAGFRDLGAALGQATLRFFTIEHPFAMILALVVLHVGKVRARRHGADPRRHRTVLIAAAVALALIALSIPWPGLPYARPLLRAPW
jgi:hypothetical protein